MPFFSICELPFSSAIEFSCCIIQSHDTPSVTSASPAHCLLPLISLDLRQLSSALALVDVRDAVCSLQECTHVRPYAHLRLLLLLMQPVTATAQCSCTVDGLHDSDSSYSSFDSVLALFLTMTFMLSVVPRSDGISTRFILVGDSLPA